MIGTWEELSSYRPAWMLVGGAAMRTRRGIGRVLVGPGDPRLGQELARPEGRLLAARRIPLLPVQAVSVPEEDGCPAWLSPRDLSSDR